MAARMTATEAREFLPVLRALREAGMDPTVVDIEPDDISTTSEQRRGRAR